MHSDSSASLWLPLLRQSFSSSQAVTAHAQAPSPGDACSEFHATTQDDTGRTMWCNPTMTGSHSLVWQYGGPA